MLLSALRTGALFAIIDDEVMIMVYHKGYDAVYTVLCSSSGSGSGGGGGSCIAEKVQ